jgi:hypothetical protein
MLRDNIRRAVLSKELTTYRHKEYIEFLETPLTSLEIELNKVLDLFNPFPYVEYEEDLFSDRQIDPSVSYIIKNGPNEVFKTNWYSFQLKTPDVKYYAIAQLSNGDIVGAIKFDVLMINTSHIFAIASETHPRVVYVYKGVVETLYIIYASTPLALRQRIEELHAKTMHVKMAIRNIN